MADGLACFRCGASLDALSLPLSRRDECPQCSIHLHVCRMCVFYSPHVPRQCTEDDAEEVFEKEKVNFCEWYKPSGDAFDPARASEESRARSDLGALFGEPAEAEEQSDPLVERAEDLFK